VTILKKNNINYMMDSTWRGNLPIRVSGVPDRYSHRGDVYNFLRTTNVQSARFRPEKTMTFKQFADSIACFEHSNPEHYKLYTLMVLTQMLSRANFRICTPAGFGKDSVIDVCGHLFGAAHTIENPTIAKLEMMTYAKLLAVNEVVDIAPAEWRNIEQFLLSTGAFKNHVTKRSRAFGGSGEILDTSQLSLSLMYNDIDHYAAGKDYFDDVTKTAVKDRFPALRFYGNFQQDFNKVSKLDVNAFVKTNLDEYVKLIRAFHYYKNNLHDEVHFYNPTYFNDKGLPERWVTNLSRLNMIVDCYSESREEYETLMAEVDAAVQDYKDMLTFRDALPSLAQKMGVVKEEFMKEPSLKHLKALLKFSYHNETFLSYVESIIRAETFSKKLLLMKYFNPEANHSQGLEKWG
jgi:hypothetical protein